MSSFTDFIKLQEDVAHCLLCDEWLSDVNVLTRDKLLNAETLARLPDKTLAAEVLAYIIPRNKGGKKGCGIIVEKPEFDVTKPNMPGPQGDLIIVCLILEDRLVNEAPSSGTLKPADQVAQRILENTHGWRIGNQGAFYADTKAIVNAKEFEDLGLCAYRARIRCTLSRLQTDRVQPVVITTDGLEVTLTCATADADIYYTDRTDDALSGADFPGPSNTGAKLYEAPFTVESGTIIRAAAYKNDYLGSNVTSETISA